MSSSIADEIYDDVKNKIEDLEANDEPVPNELKDKLTYFEICYKLNNS